MATQACRRNLSPSPRATNGPRRALPTLDGGQIRGQTAAANTPACDIEAGKARYRYRDERWTHNPPIKGLHCRRPRARASAIVRPRCRRLHLARLAGACLARQVLATAETAAAADAIERAYRLAEIRKARHLTLQQIAAEMGVPRRGSARSSTVRWTGPPSAASRGTWRHLADTWS